MAPAAALVALPALAWQSVSTQPGCIDPGATSLSVPHGCSPPEALDLGCSRSEPVHPVAQQPPGCVAGQQNGTKPPLLVSSTAIRKSP